MPSVTRNLKMAERNVNRLLELAYQLLDFRKTEINQFGLSFVNTDIAALLNEQIAAFNHEIEKKKLHVQACIPSTPVMASVDVEAFVKICSNLISNAVKYADSKVVISVAVDDNVFSIVIKNDGKPIPSEYKNKIFEPFFRINDNLNPGTGIGLSLAKSLAELHNGSLKLISDENNLNAFELTLPVQQKISFKLGSWKKNKPNEK